jgi:hypothetical protein
MRIYFISFARTKEVRIPNGEKYKRIHTGNFHSIAILHILKGG